MMDHGKLVWGAADWFFAAAGIAAVLLALLTAAYWRAGASPGVRLVAAGLKTLGILILALCLLEPLFSEQRARPGANQFVILEDNSQSMGLKDGANSKSRGEQLKAAAAKDSKWVAEIARTFDLRQFAFDSQLKTIDGSDVLAFDGRASDLGASLDRLLRRFQGRPLAGVLLFTDGSATDPESVEQVLARMNASPEARVPIYPVLMGQQSPVADVSVNRVVVAQTNFEDAPVTLTAELTTSGEAGKTLDVQLVDETGKPVDQIKAKVERDGEPIAARFRVKPEQPGVSFYRVRAAVEGQLGELDDPKQTMEATVANNTRLVTVDRGKGPYRVLYVSGRPNWEYKFLERSVQSDDQVQLVGMIRVAKREPKFNFMGRVGDSANPLFRGFDNRDSEQVEQYDQPVIVRMGITEESELKGGFPKGAEELFKYHAIVLDDVEAEFFSQDQMQLIKDFVRQRGGGLLMLGGQETFKNGKYDKTPIGDLLPVYCDQGQDLPVDAKYKLALTREGWLEPWLRLRSEEDAENQRLASMPEFQALNPIRGIKPGATVLARVTVNDNTQVPALVEQRFGHGRAAALLIGDLWRWELHRPESTQSDMEKAWRQMVRWLVADVPQRVEVTIDNHHQADDPDGALHLVVQARDPSYSPVDNAAVNVRITPPGEGAKPVDMRAEPSAKESGKYEAVYVPREPGAYRVQVHATAADGSDIGQSQAGWTSDPAAEEFRELQPNASLLDRIASSTGGQVIKMDELDQFAASLPSRHAQITEPFIRPFWHQSWVFLLAIACLAAEWGLRRWKGLP